MDPLLKQLRELPSRLGALPGAVKALLALVVAGALAAVIALSAASSDGWQYAFTNLTAEASAEAPAHPKHAGGGGGGWSPGGGAGVATGAGSPASGTWCRRPSPA